MDDKMYLLVDGDTIAFRAAITNEKMADAITHMEDSINWLRLRLGEPRMEFFLTGDENFRYDVYPAYKGNRKPDSKPPQLAALKQYLKDHYMALEIPGLEADDLQGIESYPEEGIQKVVVSVDKDLRQIAGSLFNPGHPELGIQTITQDAADIWFYTQWMTGDTTDGYSGIPGVGPKKAEAVIKEWLKDNPIDTLHIPILQMYADRLLPVEYAMSQARCARILRPGEYDKIAKKVALWSPS